MKSKPAPKIVRAPKRLSFAPLSFDEAVTDILKVKPEPKSEKKHKKSKHT